MHPLSRQAPTNRAKSGPVETVAIVLVVDDEFGIGELLEALLLDDGHRAITAMNGRHAIERMTEARPDLVISDLMMPVMDGGALRQAMLDNPEWRDIPFALMCAVPEASIKDRISQYDAFLRKPFKLAEISRLVARLLDQGKSAASKG
jgi:CheY-like chemotaxis protein